LAHETELIRIHTSNKYSDARIGYGVFPVVDKLSDADRKELLETLLYLAAQLNANEYPFSRK
jgi:hypothetical protein